MKTILTIFCCVFGLFPLTLSALEATKTADLFLDENGLEYRGTCRAQKICKNEDDYLHIGQTGTCYISDNDGSEKFCRDNQMVCILGISEEAEHGVRTTNGCWISDTGADDKWLPIDLGLKELQMKLIIPICSGFTNDSGKQAAFMDQQGKIITDASGKIAKSIVSSMSASNALARRKNIKCIAYVCTDSDGRFANPAPDGSCDYKQGNVDGTNSGRKYRNSVQPYLDALKTL